MTTITIYKITGKHGPFTVSKVLCKECDLSVSQVNRVSKELGEDKVKVVVKSWFGKIFEVIPKGGWHAPVIMIDNKIYSQGIVPDYKSLKEKVLKTIQTN